MTDVVTRLQDLESIIEDLRAKIHALNDRLKAIESHPQNGTP